MHAMPTLDEVEMDVRGWEVIEVRESDRAWFDELGDPVRIRLFDEPCRETTVDGWRTRALRETGTGGGALISFDEARVDGLPAFLGVFKYPASRCVPGVPATSLAVYAIAMVALPLGGLSIQLNIEAMESGSTGSREAVVALTQPRPTGPAVRRTMDEHLDRVRAALAMHLPSDDRQYDALVPSHPLSRVRARVDRLLPTIRLGPRMRRLATG